MKSYDPTATCNCAQCVERRAKHASLPSYPRPQNADELERAFRALSLAIAAKLV